MSTLNTDPNFADPDAFYEALIETHRDLSPSQSHALNARLILLLANHIGDLAVLREALAAAKAGEAGEPHPHPGPPLEGEGTAQTNPYERTVSEPSLPLQGGRTAFPSLQGGGTAFPSLQGAGTVSPPLQGEG